MLRLSLPLLLLLLVVTLAGCAEGPALLASPERQVAISQVRLDPEEARAAINRYRSQKGMKPLVLNAKLTHAAESHSVDLAQHDTISHKGSDGSNPWKRIERAGYRPRLAAENVGAGQRSLAEVIQGWKDSPGHDRNLLLPDATQMGIALVKDPATRYGTFWTLVLGTPM
jgi:uncharacterized protein YkwD